jgi:hypothetical protein
MVDSGGGDPQSAGAVIKKWYEIQKAIGADNPNSH